MLFATSQATKQLNRQTTKHYKTRKRWPSKMKFSMNNCSYWLPRSGFILSGDWVKNPIASFVLSTSACNNLFPITMKAMPMSFLNRMFNLVL